MDVGSGTMNQSKRPLACFKRGFLLALTCLLCPGISFAQAGDTGASAEPSGPETSSPFVIRKRSEYGCAEVDEVKSGALASHEITVNPRKVERCVREKVGSRFHECKKLDIEEATADWHGVVTLETGEGPVRFWIEEHGADGSGELKRIMVWTWPDTDKKYMCAGKSSRR